MTSTAKKEKEAADRADAPRPEPDNTTDFGMPDPTVEKEVRQGIEAKHSEKMVEESDAETNRKGHVKMTKHSEDIHVHPSTVADHVKHGWKLA